MPKDFLQLVADDEQPEVLLNRLELLELSPEYLQLNREKQFIKETDVFNCVEL